LEYSKTGTKEAQEWNGLRTEEIKGLITLRDKKGRAHPNAKNVTFGANFDKTGTNHVTLNGCIATNSNNRTANLQARINNQEIQQIRPDVFL
jgi:hypothetical protein